MQRLSTSVLFFFSNPKRIFGRLSSTSVFPSSIRGFKFGLLVVAWVIGLVTVTVSPVSATVGEDWELVNPLPTGNALNSITWNGSQFVAVGDSGEILNSPDGITWTEQNSDFIHQFSGITWGGSQFVAVGIAGAIFTSPEGVNWTHRTSG